AQKGKNDMTRILFAVVALAVFPLASRGGETVVRLFVQPMAAPKPALKYLLLPEVRELKPGNPAQYYLRCFAEQRNFFFSKQSVAQRARYQSMPLAKLAMEKGRDYGGNALRQADWAARLNAIDWEMVSRVQSEGMELSLPELGPLRVLAAALQVRFRIEVAGRRFDDAVRTAKTMFMLARHLGEYPAESANLTGLFVAGLAVDTLEEMVQQPACPNLYWALTDLACPLVDMRKGLQGGCVLVATEFRPLREDVGMTKEELEKVVSRLSGVMGFGREQAGREPHGLRASLAARIKDAKRVQAARDRLFAERRAVLVGRIAGKETPRAFLSRLLEMSSVKDRIEKYPPMQVILLDEKREYEVRRDEGMKLLALAPWRIDALSREERQRGGVGLFVDFLPHVIEARRAQARLEQRLALLRHVEALRLYAAGHNGKLPETLSAIVVPLPTDPFSGKPFAYKLEGTTAQLRGRPPQGEDKNPIYNIRYEVGIRK
ncbi:MAG: hypothetical protein ACRELF_06445, partial [Gemmataceae bacterium]